MVVVATYGDIFVLLVETDILSYAIALFLVDCHLNELCPLDCGISKGRPTKSKRVREAPYGLT